MFGKKAALYMGLGFELTGLLLAGLYFGDLADKRWNLKGLGIGTGAFVGLGIWMFHLITVTRSMENDNSSDE